jgi:FkbM family methyltransferase
MLRWTRDRMPRAIGRGACRLCALLEPDGRRAWALEGEDLLLLRLLGTDRAGFYVDVGAHHPERYSNTCLFHRAGWRGINIDADPEAIRRFEAARPGDINLCVGISDAPGTLSFHVFNEPALNTFDERLAREREQLPGYRLLRREPVSVERLDAVLARALPPGQGIDFLSVDVEGLDLKVLASNDWQRFRPRVVLAEALGVTLAQAADGEIARHLAGVRYELCAKTVSTLMFRDATLGWS